MRPTSFSSIKHVLLVPLATGMLLSAAIQAQTMSAMPSASMPMSHMQKGEAGRHDMKASMMKGMDAMQKMPTSGDVDRDFATMMKVHHQQALDMAEMELSHGKSADMKTMARQIIAAQKKEIAQFDRWLARQK